MSRWKNLLPAGVKDLAKTAVNATLRPLGWKLAPGDSLSLDGVCYSSSVDGVISRHRPPSLDDDEFRRALQHLSNYDAFERLAAATRGEEILYRLYLAGQLAATAARLPGEFVEFGTYRGATAYCMLNSTRNQGRAKQIYLYDTFSGIPDEDLSDHEREVGLQGKHRETSVERVDEMLADFRPRIHFRPGRIPDTLDSSGPAAIAMMHVDLNLAAPTIAALHWAYDRWTPHGICLLDDYLWQGFEEQRVAVEHFFRQRGRNIVALPTGQGVVWNV